MNLAILYLALAGGLGAVLRWIIMKRPYPAHELTLAINAVGSFVIGYISGLNFGTGLSNPLLSLVLTSGLLGGFTTFSTFSVQLMVLSKEDRTATLRTLVLSIALGILLCGSGYQVATWLD